jgi:hypothetical protein
VIAGWLVSCCCCGPPPGRVVRRRQGTLVRSRRPSITPIFPGWDLGRMAFGVPSAAVAFSRCKVRRWMRYEHTAWWPNGCLAKPTVVQSAS